MRDLFLNNYNIRIFVYSDGINDATGAGHSQLLYIIVEAYIFSKAITFVLF
jgi:hypothetical protein